MRPPPPSSDASARGIACTRRNVAKRFRYTLYSSLNRSSNSELLAGWRVAGVEDTLFSSGMELEDEWGEGRGHGG